jgi:thiamine-monophosphate kinase
MNRKDLLRSTSAIPLSSYQKSTVMSVRGATGRRFRMKQESQLVEKILRALPSIDVSSFKRPDLRPPKKSSSSPASTGKPRRARASSSVRLGAGDDAAILSPSGKTDLVLSCDAFVENTHFRLKTHPADSVGYKSLARAASDLAAMGAAPRYFLLTLALPKNLTSGWLDDFLRGMARAAQELRISTIGGDTTTAAAVSISITVVGEVPRGRTIQRYGARPGDLIYVSGKLGRAQLGLELVLRGEARNPGFRAAVQPHLYPTIQIALGEWLAQNHLATAMMDISDGLSADLSRLCEVSRVGARIYAEKIPQVIIPNHAAKKLAKRKLDPLQMALHGGDDYELLFTLSPRNVKRIRRVSKSSHLVAIGEITDDRKLQLIDSAGRGIPLKPQGWDPF